MRDSLVRVFSKTAVAEGVSYLVLLFIAMPVKYFLSNPLLVKYVGWIHGVLFIAYFLILIICWMFYGWSFKRVSLFFVASLLPFFPFVVERQLRREY
jgi:integral membrane protein